MNNAAYEQFKSACIAAGKFLCRDSEWVSICEGPEKLTYSWGNNWDIERCNNVDTFCDDHCLENDIPETECSTFRIADTNITVSSRLSQENFRIVSISQELTI